MSKTYQFDFKQISGSSIAASFLQGPDATMFLEDYNAAAGYRNLPALKISQRRR